ncbi:hypothetical protein C0214_06260 [Methylobacterium sp. DM1]|jgi:hypothetical protein|uniref:Uncharacterized protein n=2 Tax=Methylorubrum extorquens TaxID=408 RepID=C5B3L4_METEA|nr:conserved hypothetical protein [Methylorubrum extorquens CM4]ACS43046.1 Hypothetical protein MexAM1_META2p0119 [Methylorubrum extorquens AM1]AWI87931.1 hypothetical protein C0214_06260 [Methylobacterium sp. DM1]MCP1545917.1 hypothetical protein [Methylorubrum extorquens]MCP1591868.1 hypothetical protein [Methylorubrum extorquens]
MPPYPDRMQFAFVMDEGRSASVRARNEAAGRDDVPGNPSGPAVVARGGTEAFPIKAEALTPAAWHTHPRTRAARQGNWIGDPRPNHASPG